MIAALLAGAITGILSGFGVGGGTLLLIYMTLWAAIPQAAAQGINLLYFLPTAAMALPAHIKNGYIEKGILLPAILTGLMGTAAGAWLATGMETAPLHRLFGFFLICVGAEELFRRPSNVKRKDGSGGKPDTPPK